MMTPWELFDLESAVDARGIKRRYAQLLKQYRPDDDPLAFQRLRDAYEYALEWVGRDQGEGTPEQAAERGIATAVEDHPPLMRTGEQMEQQPSTEEMQVRALPDTCVSLDEALLRARKMQMEEVLQLELLCRCQLPGDRAVEFLRWAKDHLGWLTPWQPDYLPQANMAQLAQRLFEHELSELWQALPAASESELYQRIRDLASQKWMQPLELNGQLQKALIPLLEEYPGGSSDLLGRLSQLFGWSESDGYLPCDADDWEYLVRHYAYTGMWRELQRQLSLPSPLQPKERACWFLLKPMGDGERRKMADCFEAADWAACDYLAREIEERQPYIPERAGVSYFANWRQWRPQEWGGWATLYAFLIVFLVLSVDQAISERWIAKQGLTQGLLLAGVASVMMMLVLHYLWRGWSGLARSLSRLDVWISRFLVPPSLLERGSGLLIVRHVLPALAFAVLVGSWARHLSPGWALAQGAAILAVSLYFLARVTQGASPYAWLVLIRRSLPSLDIYKPILFWILIIVGSVLLSRLIGPDATQSRTLRSEPFNVCARPTHAQQIMDCERAAQMVREALQRRD
ncbi:J domain-containing protein [Ectopseudomonas guguanensis]|uniref:J domain-containing protein n=1 Tax=Ectopseudomonas guguanensis TaxID=1198456 RepID=UPI0035E44B08